MANPRILSAAGNRINPKSKNNAAEIKNVDYNNPNLGLSKERTIEDMMDEEALKVFPGLGNNIKRIIYSLKTWAEDEDALDMVDFCRKYKVPKRTLYDWRDKYSEIKQAMEDAYVIIAARKRKGALTRVYDKDVAFKDMAHLDPEWKQIDEYNDARRSAAKLIDSIGNILVQDTLRSRNNERVKDDKEVSE